MPILAQQDWLGMEETAFGQTEWFGIEEVGFSLTGMTWKEGIRF
jgi:hypothetical protein